MNPSTPKQKELYELLKLRNGGDENYARLDWKTVSQVIAEAKADVLKDCFWEIGSVAGWVEGGDDAIRVEDALDAIEKLKKKLI